MPWLTCLPEPWLLWLTCRCTHLCKSKPWSLTVMARRRKPLKIAMASSSRRATLTVRRPACCQRKPSRLALQPRLGATADRCQNGQSGCRWRWRRPAGQCLANIQTILDSIGHSLADVVKVNVFLKNIDDVAAVNETCAAYFQGGAPACRVVGVSALPGNALIQIDVVVSNPEGTAR